MLGGAPDGAGHGAGGGENVRPEYITMEWPYGGVPDGGLGEKEGIGSWIVPRESFFFHLSVIAVGNMGFDGRVKG